MTVTSVPAGTSVAPKLALKEMPLLSFTGLGNAVGGMRIQFPVACSTSGIVGGTKPSSLVGVGLTAAGGGGAGAVGATGAELTTTAGAGVDTVSCGPGAGGA